MRRNADGSHIETVLNVKHLKSAILKDGAQVDLGLRRKNPVGSKNVVLVGRYRVTLTGPKRSMPEGLGKRRSLKGQQTDKSRRDESLSGPGNLAWYGQNGIVDDLQFNIDRPTTEGHGRRNPHPDWTTHAKPEVYFASSKEINDIGLHNVEETNQMVDKSPARAPPPPETSAENYNGRSSGGPEGGASIVVQDPNAGVSEVAVHGPQGEDTPAWKHPKREWTNYEPILHRLPGKRVPFMNGLLLHSLLGKRLYASASDPLLRGMEGKRGYSGPVLQEVLKKELSPVPIVHSLGGKHVPDDFSLISENEAQPTNELQHGA